MKYSLFLLILWSFSLPLHAQITLKGKVLDQNSGQPVPYANIGILNSTVGTLSNEDGSFTITIPSGLSNRNVLFSSVGYNRKSIRTDSLTAYNDLEIRLSENILELSEVEIYGEKVKKKSVTLGNSKSLMMSGQLFYDTLSAGSAMALLIDVADEEMVFISEASLFIAKNLTPEFKVRLRIMERDSETDLPGRDLLTEDIIVTSKITSGWLDFTLSEPLFLRETSFFVVFEWIMDKKARKYVAEKYAEYMRLYPEDVTYDTRIINGQQVSIPRVNKVVAGTIFGITNTKKDLRRHVCYYRSNSFGEWKRSTGILSAKVRLTNSPGE